MLSYWERRSFLHYDHLIVGAGITGLSVALELRTQYPTQRILVVEQGVFPNGASTKNAGFACIGSAAELLHDLDDTPETDVLQLCLQRQEGLRILRHRVGDQAMDFRTNGSHELIAPHEQEVLAHIDRLNELLRPLAAPHEPVFRLATEKIKPFGFNADGVIALIENTQEGELHTGKMMRRLVDLSLASGIEIKTGVSVSAFEEHSGYVAVHLRTGPEPADSVPLTCQQLFICTNAFTPTLLPDIPVRPGRGQILVTAPLPDIPFKGIFHFDGGYYYFREIDGRVLIGGGRNLDFTGETTTEMAVTERIQADLEHKLRTLVLPGRHTDIQYRWAGIMAFGQHKQPVVQAFGQRVYGAFRFGGMGVALASFAAKQVVALAADRR